jgi:hypothetical protein
MEMCDHIALDGEVHTIGEKLVRPCATDRWGSYQENSIHAIVQQHNSEKN